MGGWGIICLFVFSLHFYTGSVKKLDLIMTDIQTLGSPRKEVLKFDKFTNRQNLDRYGLSLFTHLFYTVPKKTQKPLLFNDIHFTEQLSTVKLYRSIYKIVLLTIILDITFIIIMTKLYGQNIK